MRTTYIDIETNVEKGELLDNLNSTEAKNQLAKELIDSHREKADRCAREIGGTVRTDWKPQWYIRRGSHISFGGDFVLAASRWAVWVPDSFNPELAASSASVR